jgi:hypothetical protein
VILLGSRDRGRQWRFAKQGKISAGSPKSVAGPWSFDFGRTLDHIERGHCEEVVIEKKSIRRTAAVKTPSQVPASH